MPPCKPERAYTKSSVSTSGSTTHLLKLDAETAVAEAVEDEPDDRTDCKQCSQARPACLPSTADATSNHREAGAQAVACHDQPKPHILCGLARCHHPGDGVAGKA